MFTAAIAAILLSQPTSLTLPTLFTDHMVLQRDMPVPVFGWTQPGQEVKVDFNGQHAKAKAGNDGRFVVKLKPMKAGGPYALTIHADQDKVIDDVMVGEVWICSGQSNMQMAVASCRNAEADISAATDSGIRLFTVPDVSLEAPAKDVKGAWSQCSPDAVRYFSASAYFFGRKLRNELHVPIGLIHTSWGGTPAEAWTRREVLAANPNLKYMVDKYLEALQPYKNNPNGFQQALAEWEKTQAVNDPGNKGFEQGWASPEYKPDSSWIEVKAPITIEDIRKKDVDGAFWYRYELRLPSDWAGQDLTLSLGAIDDTDTTYFNNVQVGSTGKDVPNWWSTPRVYKVPGNLVHAGRNVIAVRGFDYGVTGGMTGPASALSVESNGKRIGIAGKWLFKFEWEVTPKPRPVGPGESWAPGALYNGMIAPLIPYGIRGAIWYQGEANAGRAYQYRELFPLMIKNWRKDWGQGDFPFYFVQLANYTARLPEPADSDWAELREAQSMTLKLKNTGMAVIIDIGEADDIHPKNKQDVGLRLALNALAQTYGFKIEYEGPTYLGYAIEGSTISIAFTHATGLVAKGGKLTGFQIAGKDRKWVWADARIDGRSVVVSSPSVKSPVAVRYGWANNPECNLYNGAGLPASPFRTDNWPGFTASAK